MKCSTKSALLVDAGPLREPVEISALIGGNVEGQGGGFRLDGQPRGGFEPAVKLGVSIGKRNRARAIVRGAGQVYPLQIIRLIQEVAVIDAVGGFVKEDEDVRRRGNFSQDEKLPVFGIVL